MRRAAAHQRDRLAAGLLQPVQHHDLDERADMQRGRGAIEADISDERARARLFVEAGEVRALVDEAALDERARKSDRGWKASVNSGFPWRGAWRRFRRQGPRYAISRLRRAPPLATDQSDGRTPQRRRPHRPILCAARRTRGARPARRRRPPDAAARVGPRPDQRCAGRRRALLRRRSAGARSPARRLRVNLSDLAAKGAAPARLSARAGAAARLDAPIGSAAFAEGLGADGALYGCPLLGGDTVKTPGPLTVSITAVGSGRRRGGWSPAPGVKPGDRALCHRARSATPRLA